MVYVFLAEGFEEIEALAVVDVLRRGGVEVRLVGVDGELISGAHGIGVKAELPVAAVPADGADCYVLPGGLPGVDNLEDSQALCQTLRQAAEKGALLCAICAAPRALGKLGLLDGVDYTCYPGFQAQVRGGRYIGGTVVSGIDRITGEGPGAAIPFALEILARLQGRDVAAQVQKDMCFGG